MLKEAEKNAEVDKSKKAIFNIIYELDNLIFRNELLMKKNIVLNNLSYIYSIELIKEIKTLYRTNNLTKVYKVLLNDLKYAYTTLTLNIIKQQINGSFKENNGTEKNNFIDVTEE